MAENIDKEYNKVFISCVEEDIDWANKLYVYLISKCYDPWLYKKNLLPGQRWRDEIKSAMEEADFTIILFSKVSVEKRSYVQREFRLALDYFEEKLDNDISIIPCKVDDCEIPKKFEHFHYVKLNESDSFNQILKALNYQRKIYDEYNKDIKSFSESNKWGYKGVKTGKVVVTPKYNSGGNFHEGLARVSLNKKWGFIDKTGKEVIPLKYDKAWGFYEGLAEVLLGDKWGFIDKEGNEIIPLIYDSVSRFTNGVALVTLNGNEFYINTEGNTVQR
jgi:hypothetical protein